MAYNENKKQDHRKLHTTAPVCIYTTIEGAVGVEVSFGPVGRALGGSAFRGSGARMGLERKYEGSSQCGQGISGIRSVDRAAVGKTSVIACLWGKVIVIPSG